jgi:hypothetical protein
MKNVAILQSNYIPWKGYFDMIAAVDEFIIYDDVQFTKNDWRNRNKIKTPKGIEWISIPVGQNIGRNISSVTLPSNNWQTKHWKTLESNYRRASCFHEVAGIIKPLYLNKKYASLSELNRIFIEAICQYLNIQTKISSSSDYNLIGGRVARLVDICIQAGAACYISGPSAKNYLDESAFLSQGIDVSWFDYSGYNEYPQLWGGLEHGVSILDLLFNCGRDSVHYMKFFSKGQC